MTSSRSAPLPTNDLISALNYVRPCSSSAASLAPRPLPTVLWLGHRWGRPRESSRSLHRPQIRSPACAFRPQPRSQRLICPSRLGSRRYFGFGLAPLFLPGELVSSLALGFGLRSASLVLLMTFMVTPLPLRRVSLPVTLPVVASCRGRARVGSC